MNKKFFTLLVGALLSISSLFTASAATPTVHHKEANKVSFADTLRADTVKYLGEVDGAYYLLSVTDIANPSGNAMNAPFTSLASTTSKDVSYVLFVDSLGHLRLDSIAAIDKAGYGFDYHGSQKISAIRRASWCVRTSNLGVDGSNIFFDFDNVNAGITLHVPLYPNPNPEDGTWKASGEGYGRYVYEGIKYDNAIDINKGFKVNGWRFSQTSTNKQELQKGMPLYSYTQKDSVLVFVLDDDVKYDLPVAVTGGGKKGGTGGWKVTVKYVAVKDLIDDSSLAGNVRIGGAKAVSNVLLFTLKKLDKFVLNANDYNAIRSSITFNPDAISADKTEDGWNPFTTPDKDGINPHARGPLTAHEVNDSLYRYGYLQFSKSATEWLYVDTAFWNYGNDQFLKFNWSTVRRDTTLEGDWGYISFQKYASSYYKGVVDGKATKPDSLAFFKETVYGEKKVYWRFDSLLWAFVKEYNIQVTGTSNPEIAVDADGKIAATSTLMATPVASVLTSLGSAWTEVAAYMYDRFSITMGPSVADDKKLFGDLIHSSTGVTWTDFYLPKSDDHAVLIAEAKRRDDAFHSDSLRWAVPRDYLGYYTDSIMENQSKFRVVYDPYVDSTYINVYQSRVAYKDYTVQNSPVSYPWWKNSFIWNGDEQPIGRPVPVPVPLSPATIHSFNGPIIKSSPSEMDTVLISTADTSVFYDKNEPLSHIYGWKAARPDGIFEKDSLLYVNIQNLENKVNRRVATITQSQARGGSGLDTKISLGFATCKPGEGSSTDPGEVIFNAGLYLIRNQAGQYLSVPIYSITDSVYWVTPEKYEDPTKMPSYQWVLEPLAGTKFTLTNREFEKVRFTYVYVTKMNEKTGIGENLVIGDHYANAKFAKEPQAKIGSAIVDPTKALGLGEFARAKEFNYTYSFLPLAADVKSDQLLGYTYIDKDSTIVDVYALKYYHFLATGDDARYLGWNGYDNPKVDSALYANFKDFHNKLYFALEEMPGGMLATDELEVKEAKGDYKSIYEKYGSSGKTITLEKFGYFNKTLGILPLARQAYRLLLKDPLKFYPTIKGDYVTVGQQDRYILADKVNAEKPYVRESGRTEGLFGVPYFYFRDTYFDVTDNNPEGEDYFALVQRLDTTLYKEYPSIIYNHDPHYGAVWQYINLVWGDKAADRVTEQIKRSRELGAFIATVGDYGNGLSGLKIAVRGESVVAPSTFTLERDADPIYRRFHWNDYLERTNSDVPLVLEFHRLNNDAVKLFENSGADGRSGGGREYNLGKDGKLKVDSLGHEISFLGIKNVYTFPSVEPTDGDLRGNTNYSIYVDTAFINRGTGWIKPQYMLAVDVHKEPYKPAGTAGPCGGVATREYASYVLARYLFNSAMYAKKIATGVTLDYDSTQRIDETVYHEAINGVDGTAYTPLYSGNTKWERLAFTWAIHRGDTLYVLKGVPTVDSRGERYSVETLRKKLIDEYGDGTENCDDIEFSQLRAVHKLSMDGLKAKGKTIGLHAMIYLGDNYHKDWVFSFRFVERRADDFVIESETEVRGGGPIIRPGRGGWVVADNNVPVISRMDTKELMGEAGGFILNVKEADIPPVSNDQVGTSSAVTVVGEAGAITVLNAAGKRVIVTNALGQTVANEVVTSDNASISVPSAGVVFVSVDKGAALKAIVK